MKGLFLMAGLSLLAAEAFACTNFIAGRKATTDGSVMVTYADDSYTRFGFLQHSPRGKHQP
ncbi:MAG: C69 family dipeptidase, partial [Muribaculaceae bacterium]|nr:C69 family dipeptidase [Muribaculaceae bacterium]